VSRFASSIRSSESKLASPEASALPLMPAMRLTRKPQGRGHIIGRCRRTGDVRLRRGFKRPGELLLERRRFLAGEDLVFPAWDGRCNPP
jgi:hypothetical protein